jgi:hypothetical protein
MAPRGQPSASSAAATRALLPLPLLLLLLLAAGASAQRNLEQERLWEPGHRAPAAWQRPRLLAMRKLYKGAAARANEAEAAAASAEAGAATPSHLASFWKAQRRAQDVAEDGGERFAGVRASAVAAAATRVAARRPAPIRPDPMGKPRGIIFPEALARGQEAMSAGSEGPYSFWQEWLPFIAN